MPNRRRYRERNSPRKIAPGLARRAYRDPEGDVSFLRQNASTEGSWNAGSPQSDQAPDSQASPTDASNPPSEPETIDGTVIDPFISAQYVRPEDVMRHRPLTEFERNNSQGLALNSRSATIVSECGDTLFRQKRTVDTRILDIDRDGNQRYSKVRGEAKKRQRLEAKRLVKERSKQVLKDHYMKQQWRSFSDEERRRRAEQQRGDSALLLNDLTVAEAQSEAVNLNAEEESEDEIFIQTEDRSDTSSAASSNLRIRRKRPRLELRSVPRDLIRYERESSARPILPEDDISDFDSCPPFSPPADSEVSGDLELLDPGTLINYESILIRSREHARVVVVSLTDNNVTFTSSAIADRLEACGAIQEIQLFTLNRQALIFFISPEDAKTFLDHHKARRIREKKRLQTHADWFGGSENTAIYDSQNILEEVATTGASRVLQINSVDKTQRKEYFAEIAKVAFADSLIIELKLVVPTKKYERAPRLSNKIRIEFGNIPQAIKAREMLNSGQVRGFLESSAEFVPDDARWRMPRHSCPCSHCNGGLSIASTLNEKRDESQNYAKKKVYRPAYEYDAKADARLPGDFY